MVTLTLRTRNLNEVFGGPSMTAYVPLTLKTRILNIDEPRSGENYAVRFHEQGFWRFGPIMTRYGSLNPVNKKSKHG
jgi:hypothetical protein